MNSHNYGILTFAIALSRAVFYFVNQKKMNSSHDSEEEAVASTDATTDSSNSVPAPESANDEDLRRFIPYGNISRKETVGRSALFAHTPLKDFFRRLL